MLRQRRVAIPPDGTVLVLADRGLSARWRFRRIVRLHWHPFLRSNQGGTFRPHGLAPFGWPCNLVETIGQRWRGHGTAFASADGRLDGMLVDWWGTGHADPWVVLTDLPPDNCAAQWYALRGGANQASNAASAGAGDAGLDRGLDAGGLARLQVAVAF